MSSSLNSFSWSGEGLFSLLLPTVHHHHHLRPPGGSDTEQHVPLLQVSLLSLRTGAWSFPSGILAPSCVCWHLSGTATPQRASCLLLPLQRLASWPRRRRATWLQTHTMPTLKGAQVELFTNCNWFYDYWFSSLDGELSFPQSRFQLSSSVQSERSIFTVSELVLDLDPYETTMDVLAIKNVIDWIESVTIHFAQLVYTVWILPMKNNQLNFHCMFRKHSNNFTAIID